MADQYEGQGGSYVIDPKTGKRELVERTEEAAPAVADAGEEQHPGEE